MSFRRYLGCLRLVPDRVGARRLGARLMRAGKGFRKYKVAPRLGAPALRRRLLSRLRAKASDPH